jgi:hypothetical protein
VVVMIAPCGEHAKFNVQKTDAFEFAEQLAPIKS